MHYCLVNYPDIDTAKIDTFRAKYDPYYPGIGAHITLIFPIPVSEIGEKTLTKHVTSVLKHQKPFNLHLKGFKRSIDHWLFLTLLEGNGEIIRLHDELYQGPLKKYLREDLPFIPHIALGLFVKGLGYSLENPQIVEFDETKYKRALDEAEKLNLDYKARFDKVSLVKIERDLKTIVSVKGFSLV